MYRNYLGSLCFLRKNVIRCYDPAIRGGEGRGRNEKEKKKNKSETSKSKWQPVSPIYAMANPNWTFFMACLTRIFLMMIFTHTHSIFHERIPPLIKILFRPVAQEDSEVAGALLHELLQDRYVSAVVNTVNMLGCYRCTGKTLVPVDCSGVVYLFVVLVVSLLCPVGGWWW